MRCLSTSITIKETQVFIYDSQEEFEKHFNLMQSQGWVGSSIGTVHDKWVTTYTKRFIDICGKSV